jgi:hypothetical protein
MSDEIDFGVRKVIVPLIRARAESRDPRPRPRVCRVPSVAVRAVAGGARCVSSLSFAVYTSGRGPDPEHDGRKISLPDQRKRSAKALSKKSKHDLAAAGTTQ